MLQAMLTQKDQKTFDRQTATRLDEVNLLLLAEQEMEGNKIWDYGKRTHEVVQHDEPVAESRVMGAKYTISQDAERLSWKIDTDSPKAAKHNLETSFVHFVYNLQQLLAA